MKSYATLGDLLGIGDGEAWRDDALCAQVDGDLFFPERGGSTLDAKRVCGMCHVRGQCLEYAVAERIDEGVWGGMSAMQRRKLWPRDETQPVPVAVPLRRSRVERDAETVRLLAAGETAPAVAEQVGVSVRTVERAIARNTATTPPAIAA